MAENSFPSSSFSSASASNPSLLGTLPPSSSADQISTMSDIQPKPRLKWTPELHGRFCEAIQFLGGVQQTQAAVAQMAWVPPPLPYLYGYPAPFYSAPPPALYSPFPPQPPQQLPPPPPPARLYIDPVGPMPPTVPPSMRVMDYSAPAPKTIIFKKLFPKGRPVRAGR
nr:transcription activator GLK2-like isoform X3 [Ipomoea batatas]